MSARLKVLVLGSTSFSGRSFMRYARANRGDLELLGLSRSFGYDINANLGAIRDRAVAFMPEYVVNFAALNVVGDSWPYYDHYYQTNVVGMSRVVDMLRHLPSLRKFVQIGTPEVYGNTLTELSESAPYNPTTPYAASRAAFDMHLSLMHRAYGFPVCTTRSVNVYGPDQQPFRVIPKTVLKVLRGEKLKLDGGGASVRSFIHIDDVSASVLRVMEEGVPGEIYHTSTREYTKIADLVRMVLESMGRRFEDCVEVGPERTGKDYAYYLSSDKIRARLGWSEQIGLREGLERTVRWFLANADQYKNDPLEYQHRR